MFAIALQQWKAELKAEILSELRRELEASEDRELTFAEACQFLGVSEYTLRRWCRTGRIPYRVVGAEGSRKPRYLFRLSRLREWKEFEENQNWRLRRHVE